MNFWLKVLLVLLFFLLLTIILTVNYIDGYRYITINSNNIFQLDREYSYKPKIKNTIISLTTIPNRLKHIKPILMSLLDSSVRVEEIRLNIPYKSCKGIKYVIPKWLTKLKFVKIYRTEKDWGPATKLLPTLLDCFRGKYKNGVNTKIIVVDDDVIYGYYMVETINDYFEKYNHPQKRMADSNEYNYPQKYNLYSNEYHSNHRKVAITMYGDKIDEKDRMKYDFSTRTNNYLKGDKYTDVLRGHAAYMVTPSMFTKEIFKYDSHPAECFFVDDNYFSAQLKLNNVRILMTGINYKAVPLPENFNGGIDALHQTHNENGKNEVIVNKHFNKLYHLRKP